MPRPEPRLLTVLEHFRVSPNMHRVTLGGEGLIGFPPDQRGGYVKLRLPVSDDRTCVRTYTIRDQSAETIDVDFALHGSVDQAGPATRWAMNAQNGDTIHVGGPGKAKPLPVGGGPYLLVGDMTSLPAILVNLEALPDDAEGHAIVLVRDANDVQDVRKPRGVSIQWLVDPDLGANPALLADAARDLNSISEFTYAWVACEFEAMKLLRQLLRVEHDFGKERLYISSYWKRGLVEDDHKQIKRADAGAKA